MMMMTTVNNSISRTETHTKTGKWSCAGTHKNTHNLSIFMATDFQTDTNVLWIYYTHTHPHKAQASKFLTTPIRWDFTDQTAGFQLASHNYVPRLPLHPLPLLSLLLTLFLSHTQSKAVSYAKDGES